MKIKILFFTSILLFFLNDVKAQHQNWGGGIDDQNSNFGFTFQYLVSEYKVLKNENWRASFSDIDFLSGLNSVSSQLTPGFGIGLVVNQKIKKNLDLRLTPTIAFSDRRMLYTYSSTSNTTVVKTTKATMLEFPLGVKLKSDRLLNSRFHILGGLKYSFDMSSKKRMTNIGVTDELEKRLLNKKAFLSYEAGLGFDLYFEWFKMTPEFKVSHSFKDIIMHEKNAFDTPIDKAILRQFTFSLFFE